MKHIYAIRDRVADALVGNAMYLLMVFRTDQEAVRYFADCILDEKSILNKHPSDYEMIKNGAVDDNGFISHLNSPEIVATGDAIMALQQPKLEREA